MAKGKVARAETKDPVPATGNVSVGNVKVESGGQAIVGTVQSGRRDQEPHPNTAADDVKAPPKK